MAGAALLRVSAAVRRVERCREDGRTQAGGAMKPRFRASSALAPERRRCVQMIRVHVVELLLGLNGDRNQSNRIGDDIAVRLIGQCDLVRSSWTQRESPEQVPRSPVCLLVDRHGRRAPRMGHGVGGISGVFSLAEGGSIARAMLSRSANAIPPGVAYHDWKFAYEPPVQGPR